METKDTLAHGRVTVPTDVDVIPETLEVLKRWGGDAAYLRERGMELVHKLSARLRKGENA